jgi:hypothetical protein
VLCSGDENDFLIPLFLFSRWRWLCCSWFYFFFPLALSPNLLLRNFGFVVVAFSLPTCSLIHGFCQQWTGSWVHLTGGFLVLVFFSLALSLSVVLVPQLVCSVMETLKMSETLISRD